MCQTASVAFDLSLEEIWLPYLVGATLWVATPEVIAQPDRLSTIIAGVRHHGHRYGADAFGFVEW